MAFLILIVFPTTAAIPITTPLLRLLLPSAILIPLSDAVELLVDPHDFLDERRVHGRIEGSGNPILL